MLKLKKNILLFYLFYIILILQNTEFCNKDQMVVLVFIIEPIFSKNYFYARTELIICLKQNY